MGFERWWIEPIKLRLNPCISYKKSFSSVLWLITRHKSSPDWMLWSRLMSPPSCYDDTSCSGTTLGSQDSEPQDVPNSELDSDYVPSEMSEDRAFVASDTEQLSYFSDNNSNAEDPIMSIIYDYTSHEDRTVWDNPYVAASLVSPFCLDQTDQSDSKKKSYPKRPVEDRVSSTLVLLGELGLGMANRTRIWGWTGFLYFIFHNSAYTVQWQYRRISASHKN